MGFDDGVAARFRRYREQADITLEDMRCAEEAAREFSGKLFDGLAHCTRYAREAGFPSEVERGTGEMRIGVCASGSGGAECSRLVLALLPGAAHETDDYLMHETLSSHHTLPSAGYAGRILGWVEPDEEPRQTFAVYRDGTWRTRGMLVEKSRGRVDDPEEVLLGFCLRIIGRMIDLCTPTDGSGRVWRTEEYRLSDYSGGTKPGTGTRWLK